MSASGFTPIQLYRSSTAATLPVAGNLAPGELAINTTDEKLYFENTGGTVTLLASSAATGGTFTTVTATTVVNGLGAVGTPSYTFTGDLNTGMWSPAADTIAFSEGGAEAMRITSAGLVGIGTTAPTSTLTVASGQFTSPALNIIGAGPNQGWLRLGNNTDIKGGDDLLGLTFTVGASERMRITSAGLVGIGNTAPTTALDVSGSITARSASVITDTLTNYGANLVINAAGSLDTIFQTNGTERMRLTTAGLVGIGTTAPSAQFAVTPPSNPATATGTLQTAIGEATNNSAYQMRMGYYLGNTYQGVINSIAGGNGADLLLNPSGGNVGIGTTAPTTSRVQVKGANNATTSYDDGVKVTSLNETVYMQYSWAGLNATSTMLFATGGTERMRIDASGNLLVGTTSSASVSGDAFLYSPVSSNIALCHSSSISSGTNYIGFLFNGSTIGSITQSGTTAVLYNVTSDARLKENISDADNASSLIDALQVRKFDWKAHSSHQRYGFVAQELLGVVPEAVHQPADPDEMMAVDYSKLVPMLIKEVQSLRARVAQLEGK